MHLLTKRLGSKYGGIVKDELTIRMNNAKNYVIEIDGPYGLYKLSNASWNCFQLLFFSLFSDPKLNWHIYIFKYHEGLSQDNLNLNRTHSLK